MQNELVMVCNRVRVLFFDYDPRMARLQPLDEELHPEGRAPDRELATDGPHESFDRYGQGRRRMAPQVAPHEHLSRQWARHLADELQKRRAAHQGRGIILVAEPNFLGLIGRSLDPTTAREVVLRLPRDIAHLPVEDIRQQLEHWLTEQRDRLP